MRLQTVALGVSIGLGACLPSLALAQGSGAATSMPKIEPKREYHAGVRVLGSYDSNIARSSKAAAALRGVEPEDYMLTPSATVSLVQPFGKQALFVDGSLGYDFHRENPQLDRQRHDIQGGFATITGPCHEALFTSYRASQTDLANLDLGNVKNLTKTTAVSFGMFFLGWWFFNRKAQTAAEEL